MSNLNNFFNFKNEDFGFFVQAEFSKKKGNLVSFKLFIEEDVISNNNLVLVDIEKKTKSYFVNGVIDELNLSKFKEIYAIAVFNRDNQTVEDFFLTTYVDGDFFETLGDKLSNFDEYTEKDKDKVFSQQYERNGVYTISFLKYEH